MLELWHTIAAYQFLGRSTIANLGILTLFFLLLTAFVPLSNKYGLRLLPFKWHHTLAKITITIALLHALMALTHN